MKKILLTIAAIGLLGFSAALAHDEAPFVVDLGLGDTHTVGHDDDAPWKGTVSVTANNTGTEPWGNFHFRIFDPMGMGAYQDVYFTTGDGAYPLMNGVVMPPYDSNTGYGYEIVTTGDGYSQIDLYYHNMPVDPGESVEFVVYTDNTASQHSFFGVMMWPSGLQVSAESQTLTGVKALFQ